MPGWRQEDMEIMMIQTVLLKILIL